MKKILFVILFTILFIAPLSLFSQYPEWINKIPSGYVNDYFIGKGVSKTSRAESISLASEDAIVSVINTGKITISYTEYDSVGYHQTGNESRNSCSSSQSSPYRPSSILLCFS